MFKLNPVLAAVAIAWSGNTLAQTSDTLVDEGAVAIDSMSTATTPISTKTTLAAAAPTAAEKTARSYQPWLNQINKPYANQLGTGNGAGVVVGVVDTGVQIDHPELRGQIVARYNAFNGGTDVTDQMGHGTHVSGIIAGSLANGALLEGVAPGAKIAMAKVFTTGASDSITIGKGIDWVVNVQKAPIMSLSLGSSAISMQANIQNAVSKGTLITAALGNDGLASGSWPAKFARETWANGQIIAVGALDANNKRASFSNYDASLANWTVFAPGVNMASSYSVPGTPNAYAYMSGTSMATPVVAGQAALIKSNWNFLTAPDLSQIIFQSATHLCSDAATATVCLARKTADAMYGWGLVNVGASLQPIGSLNLTTKTGTSINYAGTSLASAKSGVAAGLPTLTSLGVDKFNRAFVVNVGSVVTAASTPTGALPVAAPTVVTAGGAKFSAEYTSLADPRTALGLTPQDAIMTLAKMSYSFTQADGKAWGLGTGATSGGFLGLQATGTTPLSLRGDGGRFNAPYFNLAENANHVGYSMPLASGDVLRMAAVVSDASMPVPPMSLAAMEWQTRVGSATAVLTLGQMTESDALMGMHGSGALALAAQSNTTFVTLAGSRPILPGTSVSAMVSLGTTAAVDNRSASLIDGTTQAQTMAWSMGLARADVWRTGDNLGLTVSMPLRTMSGNMQVTTATAQSQVDGALSYGTQSLALSPSGMEKDIELSYARPAAFGGKFTAMALLKLEPGHDAQAPAQLGLGAKYVKAF